MIGQRPRSHDLSEDHDLIAKMLFQKTNGVEATLDIFVFQK